MNPKTKVSLDTVHSMIKEVTYTRLPSGTTVVCEITLHNLHTVHGMARVVDFENYEESLGVKYSYDKALEQVFDIAAYELHTKMSAMSHEKMYVPNSHEMLTKRYKAANPVATHFVAESVPKGPRKIIHITVGDERWQPTTEELDDLVKQFQEADVNNDYVATRAGVSVTTILD